METQVGMGCPRMSLWITSASMVGVKNNVESS